jgi:hypothetical protein
MSTQNERLQALLAEVRDVLQGVVAYDASPDVSWTLTKEGCRDALDLIVAALAEPDEAEETEHQMHMRIRAGYDAAIADSWRAKVAEVERERDEARTEVEHWKGAAKEHAENHAAAVAAFHDATRLRAEIQQARIRAENERDEALAENKRLKWDLEMSCEQTPVKGCECRGCYTAWKRAEKGEA